MIYEILCEFTLIILGFKFIKVEENCNFFIYVSLQRINKFLQKPQIKKIRYVQTPPYEKNSNILFMQAVV